CMQASQTPRTF
nr:immunoglobulin light chain junction region [Macaca mulatta]MOX52395.1 immunoglobulin light chain junction region [Macaca mulatta]